MDDLQSYLIYINGFDKKRITGYAQIYIQTLLHAMSDVEYLKSLLKPHSDFPKKVKHLLAFCPIYALTMIMQGITFLDFLPILRDPVAFETLITNFVHHITSHTIPNSPSRKVDVIVGLDARGFLLGPIVALRLGAAFVPVRKRGKLPGDCVQAAYEKEYGMVRSF